ncbi:kinesin-like protein KIN-14F isoform X1 [Camellia sinensis]|uniref:kinesin-like protein KIN-14F isoform X1 n=1 Tax=Camellia sinensis TaxID=4442 RepID=UPI001035F234|nr:kinesin-like protein KIN-14F isoform X1 [Camellia sinensis]
MTVRSVEKRCSMLMSFTKLELTRVNSHGSKFSLSYIACQEIFESQLLVYRKEPLVLVRNNSGLRQKRQSFDLDELLGSSTSWPPVTSPGQNFGEDDRETGLGEWVDKVMVNKQEAHGVHNPLGRWDADDGHMSDVFWG